MVRPDRERLHERVEVDETYIGGTETGLRGGRQLLAKALVVGAVELRHRDAKRKRWKLGRIRLEMVPDATSTALCGFVQGNVDSGATVHTDGWKGYLPLRRRGFEHERAVQGHPSRAEEVLPHIHHVFGNLQTWLRGTHHGVSNKHLPAYLDEYAFRFNRRRTPMAAFQTILGLGSQLPPTTHKMLYGVETTG
jgi:transposase-like protein